MFIQSISKAMAVLEAFEPDAASLGLSDLASKTNMTIGSVQRITYTLTELGYLEKDPERKLYRVGPRVLSLGRSYMQSVDLQRASEVPMRRLADESGQTVNVTVQSGKEIVYVLRIPSKDNVVIPTLWIGSTLPLHYTSMGRAILAFMPGDELASLLTDLEFPIITHAREISRQELEQELKQIRELGYAINDRDLRPDLRSIGAPVFAHDGSCVAALGISVRTSHFTVSQLIESQVPLLLREAAAISRNLGYEMHKKGAALKNTRS